MTKLFSFACWRALLTACATRRSPQRHAWITGLKPEKAARYRDLHAHPWPGVNKMIKDCHIRNFSIHECEIDGKLYLFAYLEYTGRNFELDMKKMAAESRDPALVERNRPLPVAIAAAAAQGKDLGRHEGGLLLEVGQAARR